MKLLSRFPAIFLLRSKYFTRAGMQPPSELELELKQTHMTQKPMLRIEVGAVFCSRCACVAHKGHADGVLRNQ
jgi:hypothetical protein